MIGSGIFLVPATLGAIGSISLIGWLLATVGAFATAAVFADLGRISRSLEGMVGFAKDGLGGFAGFAVGLSYWMSYWVAAVAIAVAAAGYLAVLFPVLAGPAPLAVAAAGVIWLFTLANLTGANMVARLSAVSLAAGLAPVLGVAALGWFWFDPGVFAASWNVSGRSAFGAVQASMIPAFWAFTGLESAAVAAAVVRDPRRNVPIATYAGVALAAAIYIGASAAIMGLAPARQLAASTAPFALVIAHELGPGVGAAVALCALLKTCGTLGNVILITAETGRAGADVYLFPGRFAPDRPRSRSAILLIMAVVMSAAALASVSPTLGRQYGLLINVSTLWIIIPYLACCLALWRMAGALTRRAARIAARAGALAAFVFNLALMATADPISLWLTGLLVVATVGLWLAIVRARGARRRSA